MKPFPETARGYVDPAERLSTLIADNAPGFAGGFAAPDMLFTDCHPIAKQQAHEFLHGIGMKKIAVDDEYGVIFARDHRATTDDFFDAQGQGDDTDDAAAA